MSSRTPGYVASIIQFGILFLLLFDIVWWPFSLTRRDDPPIAIALALWGGACLAAGVELPKEVYAALGNRSRGNDI